MTTTEYEGVILAAGRGTRMAPFSEKYPKPLLPICNKPVIEYHIDTFKKLGILDLVILIGHKGYEITKYFGDGTAFGVRIRYVEQTSTLGIAHAVGRLEPHLQRPFLLVLGDIFFISGDLRQLIDLFEEQGGGAVLATKEEFDPEAIRRNFSIAVGPDGFVTRVVEKPRYTQNRLKGVGIYLFDLSIFDSIRRTPRTAMRDEYEITDAIQVLIGDRQPVRAANVILDDINLTTPADVLRCNLIQARGMSPDGRIGANTRVNPDATVEDCVIGANVDVKHPIKIAHSVIFDHTCVNATHGFEHCIVTPDVIIDCKHDLQLSMAAL
ncbi:MAG: NTP transferase domain-containing protein [Nitrospirae bacterium]|nr:NTP transferase domain-containing protein [Nitrospirota bacterium]